MECFKCSSSEGILLVEVMVGWGRDEIIWEKKHLCSLCRKTRGWRYIEGSFVKFCKHCGKGIPHSTYSVEIYCSDECKKEHRKLLKKSFEGKAISFLEKRGYIITKT